MAAEDKHKQRLYWQCRRGMLELDELLQSFVDHQYDAMDAQTQAAFQKLIRCSDQDLQQYLLGRTAPKDGELAHVVQQVRRTYQP